MARSADGKLRCRLASLIRLTCHLTGRGVSSTDPPALPPCNMSAFVPGIDLRLRQEQSHQRGGLMSPAARSAFVESRYFAGPPITQSRSGRLRDCRLPRIRPLSAFPPAWTAQLRWRHGDGAGRAEWPPRRYAIGTSPKGSRCRSRPQEVSDRGCGRPAGRPARYAPAADDRISREAQAVERAVERLQTETASRLG
jgi:hypothetical protein